MAHSRSTSILGYTFKCITEYINTITKHYILPVIRLDICDI